MVGLASCVAFIVLAGVSTEACTIFLLADADRVLFCNNEDCKNSHTRVWFVPAAKNRFGCVYVGLRNQWAQGGMNTKGLAFDGVAGISLEGVTNATPVALQAKTKRVRGNPSERMLESCGSVNEAIAFYENNKEPTFSYATIMVADRSDGFAVLGAKGGRLNVLKGKGCAAWGWNGGIASKLISQDPTPVVANAVNILDAARSRDEYATRYSNVFDVRTGDIVLFDFSRDLVGTTLHLAEELGKGRHFYDMRNIREQMTQTPKRPSRLKECLKNVYCWFHGNG
jgi:hypothetical protein